MARLSAALANTHTAGELQSRARIEQPAVAELKALSDIDFAHIELDAASLELNQERHSDDLRLGRPPFGARSPGALMNAMSRTLRQFRPEVPVAASEEALIAEARLMSVVKGIHELKVEIEAQRKRAQSA